MGRSENLRTALSVLAFVFALSSAALALIIASREFWSGVAWLGGSLICLGAGIALHGVRHPETKSRAGVGAFCFLLYVVGMAVVGGRNPIVEVFGVPISGFWWGTSGALIGAILAFTTPVVGSNGARKERSAKTKSTKDLIRAYGASLERCSGATISHVRSLPAPKAAIDEALLMEIANARSADEVDTLAAAFLQLAAFRDDITPADEALDARFETASEKFRAAQPGNDAAALVKEIAEISKRQSEIASLIAQEMQVRQERLNSALTRQAS